MGMLSDGCMEGMGVEADVSLAVIVNVHALSCRSFPILIASFVSSIMSPYQQLLQLPLLSMLYKQENISSMQQSI